MAKKYDLTNKKIGKLTVLKICPVNERPTQTHGNYWICQCECGNECKVPTSYLSGNGKYTQTSCGCDRKKKAFQTTSYINVDEDFLEKYNKEDFEKFLLIHKALNRTTNKDLAYYNNHLDEYKQTIDYDWSKPSLDHIIPLSRGGADELSNYQFLTTFENLAKRDMTMEEWNKFKIETNTTSDYFIENIVKD